MTMIVVVALVVLLFGGCTSYYSYARSGGRASGLGSALGVAAAIFAVLWLMGGLGGVGQI